MFQLAISNVESWLVCAMHVVTKQQTKASRSVARSRAELYLDTIYTEYKSIMITFAFNFAIVPIRLALSHPLYAI